MNYGKVNNLKPGDQVMMVNCLEAETYKDKVWTVRSEPWKLGCGEEVVLLENKAGGFATRCLRKVMTLDEAITHAELKATAQGDCGREHAQLAEWLKELQRLRSNPVTSITVTPNVKEPLDSLEPDIKLNVLLHTLCDYMNEGAISGNEVQRIYDRVTSTELRYPINYLNALEDAAREVTNACVEWWHSGKEKPEYECFINAVFRMKAILDYADVTRRPKEEKGLQV